MTIATPTDHQALRLLTADVLPSDKRVAPTCGGDAVQYIRPPTLRHHLIVMTESPGVDAVVLPLTETDIPLELWLTEILNVFAGREAMISRRAIEESVNWLAARGLLTVSPGGGPQPTGEGHRVARRLRRFRSSARAGEWLHRELEGDTGEPDPVWRLSAST